MKITKVGVLISATPAFSGDVQAKASQKMISSNRADSVARLCGGIMRGDVCRRIPVPIRARVRLSLGHVILKCDTTRVYLAQRWGA